MKICIEDVSSIDVMWNDITKSQIVICTVDDIGNFYDLSIDKEQAQRLIDELQKMLMKKEVSK
jgi:hypothetical protein